MPTYEYQCQKCKCRFEEFQKISDPPLVKCPKCGGGLERLISGGSGLIFKGSGFYITDYKNKPRAGEEKKAETTRPAEKTTTSAEKKSSSTNPDKKSDGQ
jgi:putative FmdB family regulatory protein